MFETIRNTLQTGTDSAWGALSFICQAVSPRSLIASISKVRTPDFSASEVYRVAKILESGDDAVCPRPKIPSSIARANQIYLKPILASALEGHSLMQKIYDQERLTSLQSMPSWVQQNCYSIAEAQYKKFRLTDHVARNVNCYSGQIGKFKPFSLSKFDILLLESFVTTQDRVDFYHEVSANHFSGLIRDKVDLSWTLLNRSPRGNHARAAFFDCLNFIHAARITLDICKILEIDLPEKITMEIVRQYRNTPWQVPNSEFFQRMFKVSDVLARRDNPTFSKERSALLIRCIHTPPRLFLPELMPHSQSTPQMPSSNSKRSRIVPERDIDEIRPSTLSNTIVEALHARLPDKSHKNSRHQARELYKVIKRGHLNLDETLAALTRGLTAEDLLAQAATSPIHLPCTDCDEKVIAAEREIPKLPSDSIPSQCYTVRYGLRFENWVSSLNDSTTIARIDRRLKRIENGHLGDFKMVRGGVIELRENSLRIYIRKTGAQEYQVITGGDKSTQDSDIDDCQLE